MNKLKPTVVLKTFFGLLPNQTLADFAAEVRTLRENEASYREAVTLAAEALDKEVEWE